MIVSLFVVIVSLVLIVAPDSLGYDLAPAAELGRVIGSLTAMIGLLAFWEVLAPVLRLCVIAGAALVLSPLWLKPIDVSAGAMHLIAGLFLVALGLVGRRRRQSYGGGWKSVVKNDADFTRIRWE